MKNVQVIDGAVNSTFDIYAISEDTYNVIFSNGEDVVFLDSVEVRLRSLNIDKEAFWQRFYRKKVLKKEVEGIHGTLHLTGSFCQEQYFPTHKENEVLDTG